MADEEDSVYDMLDDLQEQLVRERMSPQIKFAELEEALIRFRELESNLDNLKPRVEALEPHLKQLEPRVNELRPRLEDIEPRLSRIEPKLSELEPKLAKFDPKIAKLKAELSAVEDQIKALKVPEPSKEKVVEEVKPKVEHLTGKMQRNEDGLVRSLIFEPTNGDSKCYRCDMKRDELGALVGVEVGTFEKPRILS